MAFEPGQSGNPEGRPRKSNKAAGMAREQTEKAVQVLINALADDKTENRIKAAESLLNRGWGKPQEYVELSGDDEKPIHAKLVVEFIKPNANPGSV